MWTPKNNEWNNTIENVKYESYFEVGLNEWNEITASHVPDKSPCNLRVDPVTKLSKVKEEKNQIKRIT